MVWLLVAYVLEMRYTTPHLEVLATYHQVKLDLALPVQITDSNSSSRLSSQINELLNRRDAVALLVYNQRTMLLYSTKDGKIVLIDSHQHGEKMGLVIIKGTCSHLAEFLNSVQEVLNMNETSYAELICFS